MRLSIVIITFNEEANLGRALQSVQPLVSDSKGEIIVVDSGSTDRTVEIAESFGAKVFVEDWKGFAAQKNSAIDKAQGDWILSLDADEEANDAMRELLLLVIYGAKADSYAGIGMLFARQNYFMGRWIRHGGFYPDRKLRLFWRGLARFEDRSVHEDLKMNPGCAVYDPSYHYKMGSPIALIHHSYLTLSEFVEHMNRYSSLGAEMVASKGKVRFSFINIVLRPVFTFIYN